jgi:hypothetical protein
MRNIATLLAALATAGSVHAQTLADALEQAWTRQPQTQPLSRPRARTRRARAPSVAAGFTPGPRPHCRCPA